MLEFDGNYPQLSIILCASTEAEFLVLQLKIDVRCLD